MNHNINWATYVLRMKISRRLTKYFFAHSCRSTFNLWLLSDARSPVSDSPRPDRSGSAGRTIQSHKPYVDDATLLLSVQNEPQPVIG